MAGLSATALAAAARLPDNGSMEQVIRKTRLRDQAAADLAYWQSRTPAERIAAVEELRQRYIAQHFDAEPGFQRICRVAQRSRR